MSREVIGTSTTVADLEHERVPVPRHDARPVPVTDLDRPTSPEVTETGRPDDDRSAPSWRRSAPAWLWGPAGVVAAVVAGLLAGVLVGAGVAERSTEPVRLLGGLTYPQVGFSGAPGATVVMDLLVVNAGAETVTVVGGAFANDFSTPFDLPEPFDVEPGASVRGDVRIGVNCEALTGTGLLLTVETRDGRTQQVEPAGLDNGIATLGAADLAFACQGLPGTATLEVSSLVARGDGSISLTVRNRQEAPVDLSIDGPTGTTILSEPPLPVRIDAGSGVVLILTLRIDDCRTVSIRPGAGGDLGLVVEDAQGRTYPDRGSIDPVVTAGWFARQVALTCG